MKIQAQPADYAAALMAALREVPAVPPAALAEGFFRVLEEDGMLPRWRQVEEEMIARAIPHSGTVARAADAEIMRPTLGPDADVTVDHRLIGGAVIRRGDMFVDGSVAGRLEKLRQLLHQPS